MFFILRGIILAALIGSSLTASAQPFFNNELKNRPEENRTCVWMPLGSFILPGLGQWSEGQIPSAAFYSGLGVTSVMVARGVGDEDNVEVSDYDRATDQQRLLSYSLQVYQTVGSLSAYQSFRTAVNSRRDDGQFQFLEKEYEEDAGDLLLAPLQMGELLKPTTYIPLGLLTVAALADWNNRQRSWLGKDVAFSLGTSYNAGVGEEALFRGYMMPLLMEQWDSPFWSNFTTALVFGALHISPGNPVPWPQFTLGYYLGWLSQRNHWTLKQSIFIHAWWDVIAFTIDLTDRGRKQDAKLFLPLVSTTF
jgi:hypothetical protein